LKICFDDIIDEVAEKLSAVINKPKDDLKFYKDGNELE
jgi:hypothetical protein